ncbi:MAG: hypothetical protein NZL93_01575 [Chthoniobacterales bacterium]|nr:hypothetical protein [Chthoniobacterales bacterium]
MEIKQLKIFFYNNLFSFRLFLLGFIGILPWIAKDFYQLPVLAFDNFTDSVFYPSYATNFSELVLRYGFIYYAMRFGVIFPDALFFWFFGNPDGIILLRMTLQSILLIIIFLYFEKQGGILLGVLAVVIWWANPVSLRALCTTYLDSLAMPFFLVGVLLTAWPKAKWWMGLTSGVLLSFCASAHLYLLVLIPLFFPFVLASRWNEGKSGLKTLNWVIIGAFITWISAWAYYREVWGIVDLWAPTKEVMKDLSEGLANVWKRSISDVVSTTPAWLSPFPILLCMIFFLKNGGILLRGAWITLGLSAGFFWVGDLLGGAYALSMPYYFSFLFPAVFLANASCFSFIMNYKLLSHYSREYFLLTFLFIITGFLASSFSLARIENSLFSSLISICFVLFVCIFAFITFRKFQSKFLFFLVVSIYSAWGLILATPFYSQFLGDYKRIHGHETWQPVLVQKLSQLIPPAKFDSRIIRFWYDDSEPGLLRMVQSSNLHTFSMLKKLDGTIVNFRPLSKLDIMQINETGVELIIALDEDSTRVYQVAASVPRADSSWEMRGSGSFYSGKKGFCYVMLVRKQPAFAPLSKPIPLSWQQLSSAYCSELPEDAKFLVSPSKKWFLAGVAEIPNSEEGGILLFEGRVLSGRFRLLLQDAEEKALSYAEIWPTEKECQKFFLIPKNQQKLSLLLVNLSPNGSVSKIIITRTEYLKF